MKIISPIIVTLGLIGLATTVGADGVENGVLKGRWWGERLERHGTWEGDFRISDGRIAEGTIRFKGLDSVSALPFRVDLAALDVDRDLRGPSESSMGDGLPMLAFELRRNGTTLVGSFVEPASGSAISLEGWIEAPGALESTETRGPIVSPEVSRMLRESGFVDVFIAYQEKDLLAGEDLAIRQPARSRTASRTDLNNLANGRALRVHRILMRLPAGSIRVLRNFEHGAVFSARLLDPRSLEILRDDPMILSVREHSQTIRSSSSPTSAYEFIGQPIAESFGYTGAGTTIVNADDGVDYMGRAAFGPCLEPGLPAGICRVSHAVTDPICFGGHFSTRGQGCVDDSECLDLFGFCSETIVPGFLRCTNDTQITCSCPSQLCADCPLVSEGKCNKYEGLDGNYHGDVSAAATLAAAPGTQLVSFDITGPASAGNPLSETLAMAAMDWTVENFDDPDFSSAPIVAINLELSDPARASTSPCSGGGASEFESLAASVRSVGIIPIVAAGNEGMLDAIDFPACVPGMEAVGGTNWNFAPDTMWHFSNRASFLSVVAPASFVCVQDALPLHIGNCWDGTSFAAPQVAAAVATLKGRWRLDNLDYTLWRMRETGFNLLDSASGLNFPRIDIGAGIQTPDVCTGDCDLNAQITVDEILLSVNIALGTTPLSMCPMLDANSNGLADVAEITLLTDAALNGCPT